MKWNSGKLRQIRPHRHMLLTKVTPQEASRASPSKRHLLSILSSMKHTLFVAKFAGIFYFSLSHQDKAKLKTSSDKKNSLAYTTGFLLGYLAIMWVAFSMSNVSSTPEDGTFYGFVRSAYNFFFSGSTLLQVVVGFFVKPFVAAWFNSLAANDVAMERIGLTISDYGDKSPLHKTFSGYGLLGITMFILKMALYMLAFPKPWPVTLCVAFYHVNKATSKMILVFSLLHLNQRFGQVNSAISALSPLSVPWKLERLCQLHFRLCHLSRQLNRIASFQLFYSFSVSLGALLFFSYYLYYNIRKLYFEPPDHWFHPTLIVFFGVMALIDESMDCLIFTRSCTLVSNAAAETPRLLHELRNRLENPWWEEHIRYSSLQFLHQKVTFTALGYFDIDYGVLNAMAGTVITYLVLFMQYDQTFRGLSETHLIKGSFV